MRLSSFRSRLARPARTRCSVLGEDVVVDLGGKLGDRPTKHGSVVRHHARLSSSTDARATTVDEQRLEWKRDTIAHSVPLRAGGGEPVLPTRQLSRRTARCVCAAHRRSRLGSPRHPVVRVGRQGWAAASVGCERCPGPASVVGRSPQAARRQGTPVPRTGTVLAQRVLRLSQRSAADA